jgi:hypothetical protein
VPKLKGTKPAIESAVSGFKAAALRPHQVETRTLDQRCKEDVPNF